MPSPAPPLAAKRGVSSTLCSTLAVLRRIEIACAALSLLALLGTALAQIIARNVFAHGLPWADTLMRHLVVYVTLFGALLAVDENRHIKIDIASIYFPHLHLALARVFSFLAMAVCAFLAAAAARFWWGEWQFAAPNERRWVMMSLILPLGFALLTVHFLLRGVAGGEQPRP